MCMYSTQTSTIYTILPSPLSRTSLHPQPHTSAHGPKKTGKATVSQEIMVLYVLLFIYRRILFVVCKTSADCIPSSPVWGLHVCPVPGLSQGDFLCPGQWWSLSVLWNLRGRGTTGDVWDPRLWEVSNKHSLKFVMREMIVTWAKG